MLFTATVKHTCVCVFLGWDSVYDNFKITLNMYLYTYELYITFNSFGYHECTLGSFYMYHREDGLSVNLIIKMLKKETFKNYT